MAGMATFAWKPSFGVAPSPRPRLHAETPTSCPTWHAPGNSGHGHAPPLDGHPTPHAATVSQLRKQLVHVSLKVDVIDQLSGLFVAVFSIDRSPAHDSLEVEPHDQKDHQESISDDHAF